MSSPRLNPEQQARVRIDKMLVAAGWVVVDYADADFAAGPGVAIREFMTPKGPMDYLLVAERKVVGSLEAKKEGDTLRQVETQADRYADGFEQLVRTRNLPRYEDPRVSGFLGRDGGRVMAGVGGAGRSGLGG